MGDVFMTGLSGGEKKRASIACELLTSPQLLILDVSAAGIFCNLLYSILMRQRSWWNFV